MKLATHKVMEATSDFSALSSALIHWYAQRASVRRLWAVHRESQLEVHVALEPTSDGDDMLPIWLANKRDWKEELDLLAQRDVNLQLVDLDDLGELNVDPDTITITEVSWRDAWQRDQSV
jgi:hypothetical protein